MPNHVLVNEYEPGQGIMVRSQWLFWMDSLQSFAAVPDKKSGTPLHPFNAVRHINTRV